MKEKQYIIYQCKQCRTMVWKLHKKPDIDAPTCIVQATQIHWHNCWDNVHGMLEPIAYMENDFGDEEAGIYDD